MDTSVQEQELAAVNRLLYEQETALAAFGQAGEAALSAAQTALQARTRQAELRACHRLRADSRRGGRRRGGPLCCRRRHRRGGQPSGIGSWNRAAGGCRRTRGGAGECSARSGGDGDQRGRKSAGRRRVWGRQAHRRRTAAPARRCSRFLFCPWRTAHGRESVPGTAWWWNW